MRKADIEAYFNTTYEQTYAAILRYISLRLSGRGAYHDICDVLQDTYGEFFRVVKKHGADYADNPKALLYKIADEQLKRKYAQRAKIIATVPLYMRPADEGEEERCIADFAEALAKRELEQLRALNGDVSWYAKKYDYRYKDEPWYDAKDAVERALKMLR